MDYEARLWRVSALLQGDELKAYPGIWQVLEAQNRKYRMRLLALLGLALNTQNKELGAYGERFFISERHLAGLKAGDCRGKNTWHYTVVLFVCLGLIERKQPIVTAHSQYQRSAVQIAQSKGQHFYATAFYSFPSYTKRQLQFINRQSNKWIMGGAPTKLTQSSADSIFGSDIRKKVFQAHGTQANDWTQSTGERVRIDLLGAIALREVEKHGFTTKTKVVEELRGKIFDHEKVKQENQTIMSTDNGRSYLLAKAGKTAEKTWNTHGTRVILGQGLAYGQQRKQDKEKFSIPEYMTCWIIRKK